MDKDKQYDYPSLREEREQNRIIQNDCIEADKQQRKSKFTDDQQERAWDNAAGKEIQEHYDTVLWPFINDVAYFVCYLVSWAGILVDRIDSERDLSSLTLLICIPMLLIVFFSERRDKRTGGLRPKGRWIVITRFAKHTSIYGYILTAFGFMSTKCNRWVFLFIFVLLTLVFLIGLPYEVIKYFKETRH